MKTILYIDGFNFYYGASRRFGIRWVDPRAIAKALLPGHEILRIRYFSALIKPDPMDPDKSTRQHTYLRALRTLPEVEIQLGAFLQSVKKMPLFPLDTPPVKVDVLKTEEKGSDVNLAVALLLDAFDDAMECAVVLSNELRPPRTHSNRPPAVSKNRWPHQSPEAPQLRPPARSGFLQTNPTGRPRGIAIFEPSHRRPRHLS
jgi:hypothetical protein